MLIRTLCLIILMSSVHSAWSAIPSRIIFPANGTDWYNDSGSTFHRDGTSVDDRNALDLNRPKDADKGAAVYSIADGFIERKIGDGRWGRSSTGQLLIKHFNPDGSTYYCGYLHMTSITSLKATQGAYVRAGTRIGNVSNVFTETIPNHLHFACYEWDGEKLRSRAISVSQNLIQVRSRPNVAITGNVFINNQTVNQSPFPVRRNRQFLMNFTVQNFGSDAAIGNYHLILTKDRDGSQYVRRIDDLSLSSYIRPGKQLRVDFDKKSISTPAGIYWLQIYHDDGSAGSAALKRVSGAPISIRLE